MSKRNKNKYKKDAASVDAVTPAKNPTASNETKEKSDDLRREFKHLAITILFILALLAALYYLDQKDQLMDQLADQLDKLFQ